MGGDTLFGGAGDDSLLGGVGDDEFSAADTLGDDTLLGGAGRDHFHDLYGANVLDGGDGADVFEVATEDGGSSTVSGGAGRDLYRVAEAETSRVYRVMDFEVGAGGDLLDGIHMDSSTEFSGWLTAQRHRYRALHVAVLSELQLWLRRKHQRSWRSARKRWNYQFLYKRCRLYQMVGRVSHLPGLRRTPPEEDGRRAGCGKSARPVR